MPTQTRAQRHVDTIYQRKMGRPLAAGGRSDLVNQDAGRGTPDTFWLKT